MNIGFIGLGTMGYPMAGHLANTEHTVCVFNRTATKVKQWLKDYKGTQVDNIAELAGNCDVIISCVGNDNDVRQIYFGKKGILENTKQGSTLIDHTTTSADLAKELYKNSTARGLYFLDAPVSGGETGAINGCLASMVGGDINTLSNVEAIIKIYSKTVVHLGTSGSGQLGKMANQICIAGVLQGLSEAITFAQASGLNIDLLKDVLSQGAAGSWQMTNRAKTMNEGQFDFGFAIDWMRKDLAFCFDEAARRNIELHCAKHVDKEYARLQKRGEGRSDTSVLIKQFD